MMSSSTEADVGRPPRVEGRLPAPETAQMGPERPLGALVQERISALLRRIEGRPVPGLYRVVMQEVERGIFAAALEVTNGEVGTAARALGIDRNTVARKAKALGLAVRGRGRPRRP